VGQGTRPTSDRAKENLFNIISEKLEGARFLDIFCGSGAIGIEALSRGAKEVVFVDSSAAAVGAVRTNLAKTKLGRAEILQMTAERAVSRLDRDGRRFDIVFLDPPYDLDVEVARTQLLADGGLIIAEVDADSEPKLDGLTLTDTRIYGRTKFLFFENRVTE